MLGKWGLFDLFHIHVEDIVPAYVLVGEDMAFLKDKARGQR